MAGFQLILPAQKIIILFFVLHHHQKIIKLFGQAPMMAMYNLQKMAEKHGQILEEKYRVCLWVHGYHKLLQAVIMLPKLLLFVTITDVAILNRIFFVPKIMDKHGSG